MCQHIDRLGDKHEKMKAAVLLHSSKNLRLYGTEKISNSTCLQIIFQWINLMADIIKDKVCTHESFAGAIAWAENYKSRYWSKKNNN